MRRLALLATMIAASAALPATAPAARKHTLRCGKRVSCRGAVHRRSAGLSFARHADVPSIGGPAAATIHPVGFEPRRSGGETGPPPPPPPPAPAGNPRFVQVRTDDSDARHLRLTPSRTSVLAGSVTVEFNNATAQDPHDLHFASLSGNADPFPVTVPGAFKTNVVTLAAGTWTLYCGIAGHEALGMTTRISVLPPG